MFWSYLRRRHALKDSPKASPTCASSYAGGTSARGGLISITAETVRMSAQSQILARPGVFGQN